MQERPIKGFTLIELLIVVAIIGILAAIAIPNFLNAQVRAKVSHQLSNLVSTTTGLESYLVDNNEYPMTTDPTWNGSWTATQRWKVFPGSLTVPIKYLSSNASLQDIFREAHKFQDELSNQIMYLPSFYYRPPYDGQSFGEAVYSAQVYRYGMWVIRSAGPDSWYQCHPGMAGDYDDGGWNRASYDPTNGTVSFGDIYRSQKRAAEDHT